MAGNPKPVVQLAIDEEQREDQELEALLEARQAAKDDRAAASYDFSEADKKAKAALEALNLGDDQVIRVGRFRIEKKHRPARHVAFDSSESSTLSIEPTDADGE